jgi:serine/threonine protein kinase/tetratricopeptide (TPR) repeat protein
VRLEDVRIDRYDVLAAVGKGGMGTVFRAWDRVSEQLVALKVLDDPPMPADSPAPNVERFEREAEVLASLDHPHIVRCLDHGRGSDGRMFLALEWLAGETLDKLLERRRLSIAESIELGLRLASSLAFAHGRGIVHRDIKPNNIIVADDDVACVKLLDFGIARIDQRNTGLTKTGKVLGTVGYMAPEQARGEANIGPEVDVFALGCVLFECIAGRPAFQGRHPMAILAKLLLEELPSLSSSSAEIPAELADLVDRMLAKQPSARPRDGTAVWQALSDLHAGRPGLPAPERPAISTSERRFVSVVAISPNPGAFVDERDTTREISSATLALLEVVHATVDPLGARVNTLLDGTVLISLNDVGHPKEQAQRAARCALWVRDRGSSLAVALVTGWGEASNGSPVGEIIDRAAELLAMAPPLERRPERGLILVDETSRQLLGEFEFADVVDGVVLLDERHVGAPRPSLLGRMPPFVGRSRELANIHDLVIEALEDREPSLVLVSGEAGLGKSRLRDELRVALDAHESQPQVLTGHGDLMTAGSAFALIGTVFHDAVGLDGGNPATRRAKLEEAVNSFVAAPERQRVAEFLGEILRVHFPDHDRQQLRAARQNAQIMADQVARAFVDFMGGFVAARPRVLMLDDLHWADAPSLKLIDTALQALTSARQPCAVVAFARPELDERFPRLWTKLRVHRVVLAPLARRAAAELAVAVLGSAAEAAEIDAMVERAGGNPLFLEELLRCHASSRDESLPVTVLGMLNMRVASLTSEVRQFLRAASVFGDSFWLEGVHALLGQSTPEVLVDPRLAALQQEDLIVRRGNARFPNSTEYGFRHSLLRESVYVTLTERDRATAHGQAGHWLVRVGEHDPAVLAQHFDLGGESELAVRYYTRAAEQALAAGDYPAAIRLAERGLELEDPAASAELWSIIADASYWSQDFGRALQAAELSLADSRPGSLHDCRALGAMLAAGLFRHGSASEPQRWLARLLTTEPEPDAVATLAWGFDAAMFYRGIVEPNEALARHVRRFEAIGAKVPDNVLLQAWLHNVRAVWNRTTGKPWLSLGHSTAAARAFEQAGYRRFLPHAYAFIGLDRMLLGDHDGAEESLGRASSLAQAESLPAHVTIHFAASLALSRGDIELALQLASRAFESAEPDSFQCIAAGLVQADAWIAAGELVLADAMLSSLGPSTAWYPFHHTWYQSTLARLRLLQQRFDDTAQAIVVGRALRASLGRTHFARRVALDLVEIDLLIARGEAERGRTLAIAVAEELLNDALQIEDPELRHSFLDQVRDHARLLSLAREHQGGQAPTSNTP